MTPDSASILEALETLHAFQRAKTKDPVEEALDAIMAALWPNCELGWNDWARFAAKGEWQ